MKKNLSVTTFKSFCVAILSVLGGYSPFVSASLSTNHIAPSKIVTSKTERSFKSSTLLTNRPSTSVNSNLNRINSIYNRWKGTRYRLGGTTKSGIDCSAFVREVMSKAFNKNMPRSTAKQRYVGHSISKANLRPGDLVFFRKNNHVGVYIGNGKFVHSSSSHGVTTSSLYEGYWSRTYTQSRRVI